MPYKHREPVSEEEIAEVSTMKRLRYSGHNTICEKCREIWRIGVETNNPELQLKAREAMAMGKAMHMKLKSYKNHPNETA